MVLFDRITGQPVGEVVTADEVYQALRSFRIKMDYNSKVGTAEVGSRSHGAAAALPSDDPPLELLTR